MKKFYLAPETVTRVYLVRFNLMMETAQEVLTKRREQQEFEEEEEDLMEFLANTQEQKSLW